MELRMQIEDQFMYALLDKLGIKKPTEAVREALTILNWAIDERRQGRVILSADDNGDDVARLVMPSLERLNAKGAAKMGAEA